MRISSSQYFTMNVQAMDDQQSTLATMYQQIATGNKLQTAGDNPIGAAQAVQLTAQSATLAQYATNQASATTSLGLEDSTMKGVVSTIQAIQTAVTSAGDGSLSDANRADIATQIQTLRNQLLGLANTTDSSGNSIFSGFQGNATTFTNNTPPAVGVTYGGDNGQRVVQITDSRSIPVGDTGTAVFQSVSPTESTPVATATAGNTGTGILGPVSVTDPTNPGNADTYSITFSTAVPAPPTGSPLQYQVLDMSQMNTATPPAPGLPVGGPTQYVPGNAISFAGESVTISGTPANNDTFTVAPANATTPGATDIFATLDNLVAALNQPTTTPAEAAASTNALSTAATKIENNYNNMLAVQTSVGGREQEVNATQTSMQTTSTQNANSLADLTSVDMASAISQYELTSTALQGAQQAFASIEKMSLFQYISGS
ncbi:flagellar hook-associated protein FlgL [Caballeronia sp.]|uniref:flagellar hook-associated protein FlgL n=1 Tax=Caballeronia sp. TaxID=1931223 RepID=UPI003C55B045